MNLKYYLRGLGIGMVVTALLMGFATKNQNHMTDEEIKERAIALGMVEQKVLSDIFTPEPAYTEAPEVTNKPIVTMEPVSEPTEVPVEESAVTPTEAPVTESPAEPTETPINNTEQVESITLTIKSGETSWSISKTLYDAGVVDNASAFDTFLCQNGYDKTIRTGTFEISKNATYEEIAEKIAR